MPVKISIHAPLTGCDRARGYQMLLEARFQSTYPSRGATRQHQPFKPYTPEFQSTHPSRGATCGRNEQCCKNSISIHAPLTGCDPAALRSPVGSCTFQPTHPSRGATEFYCRADVAGAISTHAPLTGCDHFCIQHHRGDQHFNPRTPHGVRLCPILINSLVLLFQPTNPSRGATFSRSGGFLRF